MRGTKCHCRIIPSPSKEKNHNVPEKINLLQSVPELSYAEPNYIISVKEKLKSLHDYPEVMYAEPNYTIQLTP